MAGKQEYDFGVRRLIPASVAAFGLSLALLCVPVAQAQIHGVPTSVTSTGFGGHFDRVPGVRTSVTSLGPQGYTAGDHSFNPNPQNCCINPLFPLNPNPPHTGTHHPQRHPFPVGGAVYAVPYPAYITQPGDDSAVDASMEQPQPDPADYAPGPTIFDRRGSSQPSSVAEAAYAERMREAQRDESMPQSAAAPPEPAPVADRPPTLLVFKDGHQLEVQNYAIVGTLLYDMTPGRRNKIPVADLDLTATAKENDNRGIDFQLPVRPATN